MIPYTPKEETAKIYNIPTFIFAITKDSLKGITAQEINANVIVITGARIKIILFELAGTIISLKIYFNASANDWVIQKDLQHLVLFFWTNAHMRN